METERKYDQFPAWIVLVSNLFSLMVYIFGFLIMYNISWLIAILFLLYAFFLEYRVIRYHCVNCVYWGQMCGFGKGRISAFFFKKGEASKFCSKPLFWKDMIPDLLVTLIPIVTGIVLLILDFSWIILLSVLALLILTTAGNSFIRGSLTCKYCKQKDMGCPADQLFNKQNSKEKQ